MKFKLLILGLLIAYSSLSQDYFQYYQQINKARMLAADSSFERSVKLYQQTFAKFEFEFARDCIHAVEVSCHTSEDSSTAHFIKCALRRGVPLSYFAHKSCLNVFRKKQLWVDLSKKAESILLEYESSINTEVRNDINAMFGEDQELRSRYYKWYNFPTKPLLLKKWEKLNHEQVLRMMEITKQYGFPGEKLIGIDQPFYHPKIDSAQFSAGMPIIILVHHYSKPNVSFDSLLYQELKAGNISPEHLATICDFEAKFGKGKYPNFGYYGLRHLPKGTVPTAFDSKRKEIQLLSADEFYRLEKAKVITPYWRSLK